jgi:two-component system sensor kinase FixL
MMNAADSMTGAVQNRKIIIQMKKADNNKALFAMRDFGTGIAKDNSTKIFESFYTTKSLGLGMGLSLSRNIVESHGGRIWFENNPDDGATFLFDLPFADRM